MPGLLLAMITRNGIVYNLIKSPYTVQLNDILFFFSSQNHLDKFNEECAPNRDKLYYSLYRRFKCKIHIDELYDLVLYKNIESRGFLIKHKGVYYKCLEEVILNGVGKIEHY